MTSFISDFLRNQNTQALVLDRGRSYAPLCMTLGKEGQFVNLSAKQQTCTNPFAGSWALASPFLNTILPELAAATEADLLSGDQRGLLMQAAEAAFAEKRVPRTYHRYAELLVQQPGTKTWVHRARKLFEICPLADDVLDNLKGMVNNDVGRSPDFDIYYGAVLRMRRKLNKITKVASEEYFSTLSSMNEDTRNYLLARGMPVLERRTDDGTPVLLVLYAERAREQVLTMEGFTYEPLDTAMFVEVARDDDFELLVRNGVAVIADDAYMDQRRQEILTALRAEERYAAASEEALASLADDRLQQLSPLDYFAHVPGEAVLQHEVFFTDFIEKLTLGGPLCEALLPRFEQYHGNGAFAGFFDGTTGYELRGKRLVCFEVGELDSLGAQIIQAVVGTLLQNIILYAQDDDISRMQKILPIDEAWALLPFPRIAKAIINLYRTARKFGLGVGVISQKFTDFTENGLKEGLLSSCPTRLILKQDASIIADVAAISRMNDMETVILQTVHTAQGYYSEILLHCPELGICDVARFVSNPYFYWVATTDPPDKTLRETKRKEILAETGASDLVCLDLAIQWCAAEYPRGVKRGRAKVSA
jgi:hypothetical protein